MGKFKNILLVYGLILAGCDNVLNIKPDGNITNETLETQQGIEQALTGTYYNLGGIADGVGGGELLGGDFIMIPALLAHVSNLEIVWDRVNGSIYNDFISKKILLTNPKVLSNWRRAYEVVNQVNTILFYLNNIESTEDRNRIQGEALAIRGIIYFELIRLWGPQYVAGSNNVEAIPLLLNPVLEIDDIETPSLATVQAVYDQAESDLLTASVLLKPSGTNGISISYFACQGYLARMAMQKSDFARAEMHATTVIQSGKYSLEDDFNNAFNNSTNSSEDIFAIQQTAANNTGDRTTGTGLAFYYSSLTESGLGAFRITPFFLIDDQTVKDGPKFQLADTRGTVDLGVGTSTTSTEINAGYYKNILNNTLLSPAKYLISTNVLPVMRLAELFLINAEANFEQNPSVSNTIALANLNVIRTRAGLSALSVTDFASPDELRKAIRLERRRELLFEGQHLHDLKRWDGQVGNISARDARLILPIPQAELDAGLGGK